MIPLLRNTCMSFFLLCGMLFINVNASAKSQSSSTVILANTEAMYQTCLQRCNEQTELGMLTKKGCLKGCNEMRRRFVLGSKQFSSLDACYQALDKIELNRDLLIEKNQAWCKKWSAHIHHRKGCKDAVAVFYNAATPDNICLRNIVAAAQTSLSPDTSATPDKTHPNVAMPYYANEQRQNTITGISQVTSSPSLAEILANPAVDTPKPQSASDAKKSEKRFASKRTPKTTLAKPIAHAQENTPQPQQTLVPNLSKIKKQQPHTQKPVVNATLPAATEKDTPYLEPVVILAPAEKTVDVLSPQKAPPTVSPANVQKDQNEEKKTNAPSSPITSIAPQTPQQAGLGARGTREETSNISSPPTTTGVMLPLMEKEKAVQTTIGNAAQATNEVVPSTPHQDSPPTSDRVEQTTSTEASTKRTAQDKNPDTNVSSVTPSSEPNKTPPTPAETPSQHTNETGQQQSQQTETTESLTLQRAMPEQHVKEMEPDLLAPIKPVIEPAPTAVEKQVPVVQPPLPIPNQTYSTSPSALPAVGKVPGAIHPAAPTVPVSIDAITLKNTPSISNTRNLSPQTESALIDRNSPLPAKTKDDLPTVIPLPDVKK